MREVGTPEETREMDEQLERLKAHLNRIDAEPSARAAEEQVKPGDLQREAPGAESCGTTGQNEATDYVLLFNRVLEKSRQSGESKTSAFKTWLKEHRGLARTQVTDYLAGRIKGRVGDSKRKAIEAAILASAARLGLTTRTSSD